VSELLYNNALVNLTRQQSDKVQKSLLRKQLPEHLQAVHREYKRRGEHLKNHRDENDFRVVGIPGREARQGGPRTPVTTGGPRSRPPGVLTDG